MTDNKINLGEVIGLIDFVDMKTTHLDKSISYLTGKFDCSKVDNQFILDAIKASLKIRLQSENFKSWAAKEAEKKFNDKVFPADNLNVEPAPIAKEIKAIEKLKKLGYTSEQIKKMLATL